MQWEMEWDIRWDTIESFFADIPFYVCPTPYVSYSVYIPLRMYSTPCISLRMCQTPCASHSMYFPLMCLSHSISGSSLCNSCLPPRVRPTPCVSRSYVSHSVYASLLCPTYECPNPCASYSIYFPLMCLSLCIHLSVCIPNMCPTHLVAHSMCPTWCVQLGVLS